MKGLLALTPRAKWSDHAHVGFTHADWTHTPRTVRVHHTAGPQPKYHPTRTQSNKAAERALMRDTEAFHMQSRGYSAIGYSYVIMPSGRVYEGRGFEARGAHTMPSAGVDHNQDVGVCFAGNFERDKPTVRSLVAYWRLRRYLTRRGVRIRGHAPHAATYATSCPGRNLRRALNL